MQSIQKHSLHIVRLLLCLVAAAVVCGGCRKPAERGENGAFAKTGTATAEGYDLQDIVQSGELIVVTLSGPDTYFDYQGQPMGLQYALAADFAHHEGLSLRMETAHDTTELLTMLSRGDADVAALSLPVSLLKEKGFAAAGAVSGDGKYSWAVRGESPALVEALNAWAAADPVVEVRKQETKREHDRRTVTRTVRSPYISREKGIISTYDHLFKQAAATTGWDWRLLAAQCYQESGFDANARSWAGARGLMQIMPSTAQGLGVSADDLYSPETNVRTAAAYIVRLNRDFADIRSSEERIKFVLAAYNGGSGHVRDAMALAKKYGRNAAAWADVGYYVLHLSEARYYRDPVVRYGYMIGSETAGYVSSVIERWRGYGGNPSAAGVSTDPSAGTPHPAHKANRFTKERRILTPEELAAGEGQ